MAAPRIVNRRPDEGDVDVSASTPFRFGVRDLDTRADLATVYSAVTYAKAVYSPEVLPSVDETLRAAGVSLCLSVFNDAAGATDPQNPCDQTIVDVGGVNVYRLEKTEDDLPQEGALYITVPLVASPMAFQVTLTLPSTTPAASYEYTTHVDFVGVLLGLVYWEENTGIFLLFRDDGTKRISVVGPSLDGIGTRPVEVVAIYDWSQLTTYTIFIDPTAHKKAVLVYAAGVDGEETLLADIPFDSLNEFLSTVRMGSLYVNHVTGVTTGVICQDGTDSGNYIDVYDFSLSSLGAVLIAGGSPTGGSEAAIHPTESVEVVGTEGAGEWSSVGTYEEDLTTSLHISATSSPAMKTREEPDLASGGWMVLARLVARSTAHEGSYSTGMGLRLRDGSHEFKLTLLDDFSENTIGIADSSADDDILGPYKVPDTAIDWEEETLLLFLGTTSIGGGILRLYLGEEVERVISTTYVSGYPMTTETSVSFGFVDEGAYSGDFYLLHLLLFPYCHFYLPEESEYPEDQGWSRNAAGGTRTLTAELNVDCTAADSYDVYYVEDATYDATSGAAILFRALVLQWVDAEGAVAPVRKEFGPIALVRTTTVAAQVRFVRSEEGTIWVFLSNEESDYADVLAQNEVGRGISAEIDLNTAHTYLLDVKPYKYVRLYLDFAIAPAIEQEWPASGTLRTIPDAVPPTAVVAFGSLGDSGVSVTFEFAHAAIGRGYDFVTSPVLEESTLQDYVYGSAVELLVDVEDED